MKIEFFLRLESEPGKQTGVQILTKTVRVLRPANLAIIDIDAYGINGQYNGMVRAKNGMWIQLEGLIPVPTVQALNDLIKTIEKTQEPHAGE